MFYGLILYSALIFVNIHIFIHHIKFEIISYDHNYLLHIIRMLYMYIMFRYTTGTQ